DGLKIRDQIFAELKDEVRVLTSAGIRPGLAAALVGENPASQLYVKSKIAACEQLGLASGLLTPPATVTTRELLAVVEDLNHDNNVDGILVQLDRKSTRLNSSHLGNSYAVFCLKKKKLLRRRMPSQSQTSLTLFATSKCEHSR